ncbi:DUF72 domain-containing protein [Dactylosporangium matsuzakiense]|uniref:DUF72 domain-containing protein n=1 Tax=Dactylosporangium matsuzakiense TaxID=53360 RepID=A0A9W6KID2_9ACTN|nr:DUF72 domain-containing protein [Dactylosporangium matsuzakiense]UWZ46785.1 DUF72 domain-containing protein [Dactylosporangium matsuzakiense]GLL01758.1 hypothetical protein GCM10017581_035000 [Dactylosporangium matsuzakiense]
MGVIRLGTASWADRQLLTSGWYPREVKTSAERLAFYASRFDLVEADTSYYAIPAPEMTAGWAAATPAGFTFDVKAYALLTGHSTQARTLPSDLRPAARATGMIRRSDLPPEVLDELWRRFHTALEPLHDRLGTVLLQFPPWLAYGEAGVRRIEDTIARCRPLAAAVELRHGSWFAGSQRTLETLLMLQRAGTSFVAVDMPQGFSSSVPPVLAVTASPAVVRFHGHSSAWERGSKEDKFRYAYSERELIDWAARLHMLAADADEVHVLMNNCCAGQAQRDAARLMELVGRSNDRSPVIG